MFHLKTKNNRALELVKINKMMTRRKMKESIDRKESFNKNIKKLKDAT